MKKTYPFNLPLKGNAKPLAVADLIDAEKLLRLNPLWIIKGFTSAGDRFQADLQDYATDREFTISGSITSEKPQTMHVTFTEGDYELLTIQPDGESYSATVVYSDPAFQEESEEERHTVLWLRGIQEYLRLYRRKTINTLLFRYIMNKIVLGMTPSQRKICLMLLRITAVELLVILIVVIGYVYFVLKPGGGS
jgi:hypothetical protein